MAGQESKEGKLEPELLQRDPPRHVFSLKPGMREIQIHRLPEPDQHKPGKDAAGDGQCIGEPFESHGCHLCQRPRACAITKLWRPGPA